MAGSFAHYMYVLECEDGSLYTGYSPDVEARVAAHKRGKGARYTQSHKPVQLRAVARFYSKGRALSAEARFKRLSRAQKDRLLALAEKVPLEEVLIEHLPYFPVDTACEMVARSLCQAQKPSLKTFNEKLLPTLNKATILGVPTPVLRQITKRLMARDDAETFLSQLPHTYFEENLIQALAVGFLGNAQEALVAIERLLPQVDNWAVCDQIPLGVFSDDPEVLIEPLSRWFLSDRCFYIRLGLRVLMRYFLDERFDEQVLAFVAEKRLPAPPEIPPAGSDCYYLDKARAWFFAEALAAQPEATLLYLDPAGPLDEWTRRAAIQKARESRKISGELKDYLKTLEKRKLGALSHQRNGVQEGIQVSFC